MPVDQAHGTPANELPVTHDEFQFLSADNASMTLEDAPSNHLEEKDHTVAVCCGNAEFIPMPPFNVTIVCHNQVFNAHMNVLQRGSDYFHEYFPSIVAKEEVEAGIVSLSEIEACIFRVILHYLYNSCTSKITDNMLGKVVEASRFLGIDTLYNYCWCEMKKKLDVDYFAELWTLSEAHQDEESLSEIERFVASGFVQASRTTDFLKLEGRQIKTLLRHPDWLGSSNIALVAMMQWGKYNINKRQGELPDLIASIDLHTLSNLYLGLLLADDVILNTLVNFEIKDLLLDLCAQRLVHSDTPEPISGQSVVCFTRLPNYGRRLGRTMFRLDETWVATVAIPFYFRDGAAIASYNGCIFIIGGSTYDGVITPTIYQYDPTSNIVYSIDKLATPVHGAAVEELKDKLYIVGGFNDYHDEQESLIVQQYDPVTRTTSLLASLQEECLHPSLVAIGDHLYAVGRETMNLQRYDREHKQWSVVPCPNTQSRMIDCVAWNEKLFVVNTKNVNVIEVELYDPVEGTWEMKVIANEPMDVKGVWCLNKGTVRNHMLVFYRGRGFKLYDPALNEWSANNATASPTIMWHPLYTILV